MQNRYYNQEAQTKKGIVILTIDNYDHYSFLNLSKKDNKFQRLAPLAVTTV